MVMDKGSQPTGVPASSNSLQDAGGSRIRNGSLWLKRISNNSQNASLKSDMIRKSSGNPSLSSQMVGNRRESGELIELGGTFVPNVTVATWTVTNSSCSALRVPTIGYCDSLAMQYTCVLILLIATVLDVIMTLDVVHERLMKSKLLKGACVERPELATIPYVHIHVHCF